MTIHYHGTPITPLTVLHSMAGRSFCVSWKAPQQVALCHQIGQSVMLDNGAFSFWRTGERPDWRPFYLWVETWLAWRSTWAVIPDVIGGTEAENDALLAEWPFGERGAPVWHMHESIDRLFRLADRFERVCIGSSDAFRMVGSAAWHGRMIEAMNALCGNGPAPVWLHMLRGMQCSEMHYPFASVDSTDVARNHHLWADIRGHVDRWDSRNCPAIWQVGAVQQPLFGV